VSEAFRLWCPRHMETEILVSKLKDVANISPDGGCRSLAIGEITPEQPQFSANYSISRRLDDCGLTSAETPF
jgi:hypothetical protein